jgi:hypothetical protein
MSSAGHARRTVLAHLRRSKTCKHVISVSSGRARDSITWVFCGSPVFTSGTSRGSSNAHAWARSCKTSSKRPPRPKSTRRRLWNMPQVFAKVTSSASSRFRGSVFRGWSFKELRTYFERGIRACTGNPNCLTRTATWRSQRTAPGHVLPQTGRDSGRRHHSIRNGTPVRGRLDGNCYTLPPA